MKRNVRLIPVFAVIGALMLFCGCGDGKTSPPSKPKTSKTQTKDVTPKKGKKDAPAAKGWGHLKGRFVVIGTLPKLPLPKITKDADYCGMHNIPNETIVTGEDNALANVVIYLRDDPQQIHDDYQKTESAEVTLDNQKCRFEPHICLVRSSQTLKILNTDPMSHNINCSSALQPFNELLPAKDSTTKKLYEERSPVPLSCNVHPWMRGYVLVRDNPYMAVSGKDGRFEIKNLPAGKLRFQAWHEQPERLAVNAWDRGRFEVTIEPDKTTDVGVIAVPASLLTGN